MSEQKEQNTAPVEGAAESAQQPAPESPAKEQPVEEKQDLIAFEDFIKVKMHVGEVLSSERVPETDKLLVSQVSVGEKTLQIVSGIAESYEPEDLPGKKVAVVTNLKPAKLRGVLSEGMLIAATDPDGKPVLLTIDQDLPAGCEIY